MDSWIDGLMGGGERVEGGSSFVWPRGDGVSRVAGVAPGWTWPEVCWSGCSARSVCGEKNQSSRARSAEAARGRLAQGRWRAMAASRALRLSGAATRSRARRASRKRSGRRAGEAKMRARELRYSSASGSGLGSVRLATSRSCSNGARNLARRRCPMACRTVGWVNWLSMFIVQFFRGILAGAHGQKRSKAH